MRMASVEVQNVVKVYRRDAEEVRVLDGLSLSIADGEFVALMGPSGSGKTTLLNLIGGVDQPTSGDLTVAGTNIARMKNNELARWRSISIGYIFQLYNLIPVLTALENVELPLLLVKMSGSERRKRAENALTLVGLGDRLKHHPRQLSGGQEQRVAIARALVSDPKVLLADEPTGDLDRKSAEDVLQLLERLNKEFKKTIVMVTHDPHAAERASRRYPLGKGVLANQGRFRVFKLVVVNLFRNPLRTFLTMASVTVALFLFCSLGGVLDTLEEAIKLGIESRLAGGDKISAAQGLAPAARPVRGVSFAFFSVAEPWYGVYGDDFDIVEASPPQATVALPEGTNPRLTAYSLERTACVVGEKLLQKKGWHLGQTITLAGTIFPGDWPFTIRAVYRAKKKSFGDDAMFFHYDYLSEKGMGGQKPVGTYILELSDPSRASAICRTVDTDRKSGV